MELNFNSYLKASAYVFSVAIITTPFPLMLIHSANTDPATFFSSCPLSLLSELIKIALTRSLFIGGLFIVSTVTMKKVGCSFDKIIGLHYMITAAINLYAGICMRNSLHIITQSYLAAFLAVLTLLSLLIAGIIAQNAVCVPEKEPQEVYYSDLSQS